MSIATIKKIINAYPPPVIDSISWNDDNHEDNSTYILTITAHDPNSLFLTYDVTSDNVGVIITQDTNNPNIFNVFYPVFNENVSVTYTIKVTNSNGSYDIYTDIRNVNSIADPSIDDVEFRIIDPLIIRQTISATDNAGNGLTYSVSCDSDNITITQDANNPNIFDFDFSLFTSNDKSTITNCFTKIVDSKNNEDRRLDYLIRLKYDRGIAGGGTDGNNDLNNIEYFTISIFGKGFNFGSLTTPKYGISATSNSTGDRGIFSGGYVTRTEIEYVTISNLNNASIFGYLTQGKEYTTSVSNGINDKGLIAGGRVGPNDQTGNIDYVTISNLSNASVFGNLTDVKEYVASTSNDTNNRGIFGGGRKKHPSDPSTLLYTNVIEYITIDTPSNSYNFGDLTKETSSAAAISNGVNDRGIFGGGKKWSLYSDILEITISTPGNAYKVGDLLSTRELLSATSNKTRERGLFTGGGPVSGQYGLNVIQYITINTSGNAQDFGDLYAEREDHGCTSNA